MLRSQLHYNKDKLYHFTFNTTNQLTVTVVSDCLIKLPAAVLYEYAVSIFTAAAMPAAAL